MKKAYIKLTISVSDVDSAEMVCGSVYFDGQLSPDIRIYDDEKDTKVEKLSGYDPTWGGSGSGWNLW